MRAGTGNNISEIKYRLVGIPEYFNVVDCGVKLIRIAETQNLVPQHVEKKHYFCKCFIFTNTIIFNCIDGKQLVGEIENIYRRSIVCSLVQHSNNRTRRRLKQNIVGSISNAIYKCNNSHSIFF